MLLIHAAIRKILLLLISVIFISLTASAGTFADGLYAKMQTSKGVIVLRLFYKRAPLTVSNFVGLAEGSKEWKDPVTGKARKTRYYDGLSFHRVIKDFMIQGGDPTGTGTGGPGYEIKDEFTESDLDKNNRGTLSMANAGPNTGGSQFFINLVDNNFLDGRHPVFGKVTKGIDIVDKIANVQTGAGDKPLEDVKIITASIIE